ncbi:hypothetical protein K8B33_06980 [Alcanivorax sp. JB21]|uniref:hypothetical protein n=1 Tax=Alcanivorax limicola TaxID=2874102 RepID=UPI001CBCE5C4|nr:hypothetical protein [Alcanivorax limicola]MBZ2188833.1 hypothetical protein [Alcanivorax limicola]
MFIIRKVLWVDCTAAAIAGATVLLLSGWLSHLHLLPQELLVFIGGVNLTYGAYSFFLARQVARPIILINLLVFANAAWAVVCLGLAARFWGEASLWGIAHLVGEALFVGGLAALEWSQRQQLANPVPHVDYSM